MEEYSDTFTITLGGQVENGVSMQKIGSMDKEGFSASELKSIRREFESSALACGVVNLMKNLGSLSNYRKMLPPEAEAQILVIRQGVSVFCDPNNLYSELKTLKWDRKAKQRGKVVNKHARYNLCFADFSQTPDYEAGKGRIVNFKDVPCLQSIREYLPSYVGEKGVDLLAEGNYYYDSSCGIGYHGDRERRIVIAARVGATMNLVFQWFYQGKPIQDPVTINLYHGDMYIMSEKAVGSDWLSSSIPTLRHAAGAEKYTRIGE
jgi:hypothetical protein